MKTFFHIGMLIIVLATNMLRWDMLPMFTCTQNLCTAERGQR